MSSVNLPHPHSAVQGLALLPREISRFFTGDSGQTLLVNGEPGTGKTLFTIRCLDVMDTEGDVLYVSTRVDQNTVHEMYFKDHSSLDETDIIDITQDPFDLALDVEVPFEKLKLDSLLEWIRQVADATKQLTLAFDSWDLVYEYLAARYEESTEKETMTNQLVALARQEDIRLILVSETTGAHTLEYIVDGVVTLQVTADERGRMHRHLRLEKLRGVRIGNRSQPFTLADGQFQAITPVELPNGHTGRGNGTWAPRANSKAKFSTGIPDLDRILGGGYNRGSMVHLELGSDLSRDTWSVLPLATIRNFLAHEMSVTVIPPREGSPGLLHNALNTVLTLEVFEKNCHVFETYAGPSRSVDASDPEGERTDIDLEPAQTGAPSGTNAVRANVIAPPEPDMHGSGEVRSADQSSPEDKTMDAPVQGDQFRYEPFVTYIEQLRSDSTGPVLHVISMDTARTAFETRLGDFANYVALHNDVSILITKPDVDLRKRADRVADMHFRMERLGDAIVLSGENPLTPLLGIGVDESQSVPEITLTEMV